MTLPERKPWKRVEPILPEFKQPHIYERDPSDRRSRTSAKNGLPEPQRRAAFGCVAVTDMCGSRPLTESGKSQPPKVLHQHGSHQRDKATKDAKLSTDKYDYLQVVSSFWQGSDRMKSIIHIKDKSSNGRERWSWHHFQIREMSFERFRSLAKIFSEDATELLDRVQQRSKSSVGGSQSIDPDFARTTVTPRRTVVDPSPSPENLTFISLPVVSMSPAMESDPIASSGSHLDAHSSPSSSTSTRIPVDAFNKDRHNKIRIMEDRQQLRITEVWMLVVGSAYLLSHSDLSLHELRGDVLLTELAPPDVHGTRVHGARGRSWILPPEAMSSMQTVAAVFSERMTDLAGSDRDASLRVEMPGLDGFDVALGNDIPSNTPFFNQDPFIPKAMGPRFSVGLNWHCILGHSPDIFARDMNELDRVRGRETLYRLALFSRGCEDLNNDAGLCERAEGMHLLMRAYHLANAPGRYIEGRLCPREEIQALTDALDTELRHNEWKNDEAYIDFDLRYNPVGHHQRFVPGDCVSYDSDTPDPRMSDKYGPARGRACQDRANFAKLATYIFDSFWPRYFQHEMTAKFWGAVHISATRVEDHSQQDPRIQRRWGAHERQTPFPSTSSIVRY